MMISTIIFVTAIGRGTHQKFLTYYGVWLCLFLTKHDPISFTQELAIKLQSKLCDRPCATCGVNRSEWSIEDPTPCPYALVEECSLRKLLGEEELKLFFL